MKRIQGSMGRTIAGGATGGVILGAASAIEGGDPAIGVIIGVFLGLVIGLLIGLAVFTRFLGRKPLPYFILGAVIGAFLIFFINFSDAIDVELGSVINDELIGLISGGFIGGIIAVFVSRGIS